MNPQGHRVPERKVQKRSSGKSEKGWAGGTGIRAGSVPSPRPVRRKDESSSASTAGPPGGSEIGGTVSSEVGVKVA